MVRYALGWAIGLALSGSASFASVTLYECELKPSRTNSWVPAQIALAHDTDTGAVKVHDPIIYHFNDSLPLDARLDTDNSKRTTFVWSLNGIKNSAGQFAPNFIYRATVLKGSNKISISASPAGYSNSFRANGRCKVGPASR